MRQCRNATKRKDSISQTPITLSICLASPINISVTGELNYQTYSGSGMPSLSLRLNSKYPHLTLTFVTSCYLQMARVVRLT